MKKFLAIVLAAITLMSLAACGNSTNKSTSTDISKVDITTVKSIIWPKNLVRVEDDDKHFTPDGDDYAYFVNTDDTDDNTSNHYAALVEFDNSGNICREVYRQPVENGKTDENGAIIEFEYKETEPSLGFQFFDGLDKKEHHGSDKERYLCFENDNYPYGLFSKPDLDTTTFTSFCDLNDFEVLKYFTPASEDFFIEYGKDGEFSTINVIVSFNEDGTTMERAIVASTSPDDAEYIELLTELEFELIGETETQVYYSAIGNEIGFGENSYIDQTKQSIIMSLMAFLDGKTESFSADITEGEILHGFSKPYFTKEQQNLWFMAANADEWVNFTAFFKKYDNIKYYKMDYPEGMLTSIEQFVAFDENGLACDAFDIFCGTEGASEEMYGHLRNMYSNVYGDNYFFAGDDIYVQRVDFPHFAIYGLNADEVLAATEEESKAVNVTTSLVEDFDRTYDEGELSTFRHENYTQITLFEEK